METVPDHPSPFDWPITNVQFFIFYFFGERQKQSGSVPFLLINIVVFFKKNPNKRSVEQCQCVNTLLPGRYQRRFNPMEVHR